MTAQVHERLILDGELTSMMTCPTLPMQHLRLYRRDPADVSWISGTTACWRGYIGTWEIRDGQLYLVSIEGTLGIRDGEAIHADWYSGTLVVPRGEMLNYVHMGFESTYEQELRLDIESGRVKNTTLIDNR